MELLITQPTMSTREIAELANSRNNDVCETVERLFNKGLLRSSRKSRQETTGGRPMEVYDLVERDVYLVIAGYSDEVRARIVDRWIELEMLVRNPNKAKNAARAAELQAIAPLLLPKFSEVQTSRDFCMNHGFPYYNKFLAVVNRMANKRSNELKIGYLEQGGRKPRLYHVDVLFSLIPDLEMWEEWEA